MSCAIVTCLMPGCFSLLLMQKALPAFLHAYIPEGVAEGSNGMLFTHPGSCEVVI